MIVVALDLSLLIRLISHNPNMAELSARISAVGQRDSIRERVGELAVVAESSNAGVCGLSDGSSYLDQAGYMIKTIIDK